MFNLKYKTLIDKKQHCISGKELRMILVGTVQSGKSSTGNAILGFDAFESKRSGDRMTMEIKKQQAAKEDKRVIVVDTPGLFCRRNKDDKETFLRHINKGIEILFPGPHAFIFVFSIMSISDWDLKMLTFFEKNKSLKDHIIVVFTGRDMLEKDKTDFGTFRSELPSDLRSFLSKIGTTRIFAFDNTKSDKAVEKLIEAVDMLSTAKERYFEILTNVTR